MSGEEGRRGPSTNVVSGVDIGPVGVVHPDGYEVFVEEVLDLGVRVGIIVHHVAPIAPNGGDGQQNGLVFFLGFGEGCWAPDLPVDQMGLVWVGRETELGQRGRLYVFAS